MPLAAGQRLGPYEILSPLGAGGMGEVYRARDPRLERDVAIKVLPEHFDDADSLSRFQAEAKAIAALSHPNIVSIFDTGQHGDQLYVVTELLEGETMRARLRQGPFGMRKAAEHAARVAQGLAAAHEKGIVHRDIKPENLFLLNDGRIKILDFGLARQDPLLAGVGRPQQLADRGARPTNPGAMIGTVGYLSPEQARGDLADHRSDIFSLGAVLYEMLAGHRAFKGTSPAELLSSVLRDEPAMPSEADPRIPRALDLIVHHCLEKNPDERFQSARDLAFHLDSLGGTSASQRASADRAAGARAAGSACVPAALAALALARRGVRDRAPRRRVGPRGRRARGAAVVPAGHRPARRGAPGAARAGRRELRLRERRLGQPRHLPAARGRPQPAEPHARQPRGRHRARRSRPTASGSRSAPSATAPGAST